MVTQGGGGSTSPRWPCPVFGREADKKNPPRHGGGWASVRGGMSGGSCGSVFGVVADSLAGVHAEDGEVGTPVAEGFLVVALSREFDLSLALLDAVERVADVHWAPPAFVLENVKHLVRHDQGRTSKISCDTLTEAHCYQKMGLTLRD